METYTALKAMVANPDYQVKKQKALAGLDDEMIDEPIADLIKGFNQLPCCYTLQSCYGHFVWHDRQNPHNLDPLPQKPADSKVLYRIAYIAFCIESSNAGRDLFASLQTIAARVPRYIQFCCAQWFWQKQVNSYALQVEPERFKRRDRILVDYAEALRLERARDVFFQRVRDTLDGLRGNRGPA